jgi:hypothetical protein
MNPLHLQCSPATCCKVWQDYLDLIAWPSEGGQVPPDEDSPEPPVPCTRRERSEGERGTTESIGSGSSSPLRSDKKKIVSSLNRKEVVLSKPVYPILAIHQSSEKEWEYGDLSAILHAWFTRFNERFRLQLPVCPLRLDPSIRGNCAGYFLPDHNTLGLLYEIAIRVPTPDQMINLDLGAILGTLLHEQFHLLQELTGIAGRNNYHNKQLRETAQRFGLIIDSRGHQAYDLDSPFLDLLAEFGVAPPRVVENARMIAAGVTPPEITKSQQQSKSKLRKWSCGCSNVWVGVSEHYGQCTRPDCGRQYQRC